jgi:hypothetical protein
MSAINYDMDIQIVHSGDRMCFIASIILVLDINSDSSIV